MSSIEQTRTLLLSREYEPLGPISWKRAIRLLTLGKIEVLEEYPDWDLKRTSPSIGVTVVIKIPAVARLLRAIRRHKRPVKFSRVNIYARDKYTCQYCGQKKNIADLTYDHVLPRTQGGKTEWKNIVTACEACNLRKGGHTPEQAGMRLLTKPVQPTWVPVHTVTISNQSVPDAWRDYMYWTSELQHE